MDERTFNGSQKRERERERKRESGIQNVGRLLFRFSTTEGGDKKHNIIPRNGPARRRSTSGSGISSALLLELCVKFTVGCVYNVLQGDNSGQ